MASKQTDARTAIIALMRDNRERTFNDIFNRVRGDAATLRREIRRLTYDGYLTRDPMAHGDEKVGVYRIKQIEAAE